MLGLDLSLFKRDVLNERWNISLEEHIIDMAWSPDMSHLVAATAEGRIILIDNYGDSAAYKQIGEHALGANSVSWRPDGLQFASSGQDGKVQVWDGVTGKLLQLIDADNDWVAKATYHPQRPILAIAAGRSFKCWTETEGIIYESADHASTIADIGWSPDGSAVAVAAYNGVTLHYPVQQSEPRKYQWKGSSLLLTWSPDAKYIATGEQDSTVHFWDVNSGTDAQMSGFSTKVLELSWHSSGQWLATGGGNTICIWDCRGNGPTGREPQYLRYHFDKVTQIAYQPSGHYLASADIDEFLLLWEPEKHDKIISATSLSAPATCIRWTTKGDILAVGQQDGVIETFLIKNAHV
ncbi:WD40 repeat domain-containing protein [Nitrosomonas sp. Nm166]|uniref:WD40 repeat domain-containing protein n=1 Tax=Nitrosomonas sp. Nm166 TaxID=1881054 RepID=UPI0008E45074|nr:hypothetical protein [Nitrosomonas sp. Nm166]SFD86135.1 WD40 repeat [Nitrosomonas sp. Nm166]